MPRRRLGDREAVGGGDERLRRHLLAIDPNGDRLDLVAVQNDGGGGAGLRIRPEREPRADARPGWVQRDIEIDGIDQPVRRAIVHKADGATLFGAHV